MSAGLTSGLYWASLALALAVAFAAAYPVNRWLLARGRGHDITTYTCTTSLHGVTATLLTPNPEADEVRRVRLRRMRTVALSLLVFAAVVYVATIGQAASGS